MYWVTIRSGGERQDPKEAHLRESKSTGKKEKREEYRS